ncbi:MAG: peptidoglycan DD-metalloendopeptidase family protein [Alphaproteobacteria bacterium]|nr:peptidoglycan DD-metalloendopeptidase family protein [Alphaproteobacteria bacterium]
MHDKSPWVEPIRTTATGSLGLGIVLLGLLLAACSPPRTAAKSLVPAASPVKKVESRALSSRPPVRSVAKTRATVQKVSYEPGRVPDSNAATTAPVSPLPSPQPPVESSRLAVRFQEPKQPNPWLTLPPLSLYTPTEPGRLIRAKLPPGYRLWMQGREIKLSPDGRFVFALHRDSQTAVELVIHNRRAGAEVISVPIVPRSYDIQRINNLPTAVVSPTKGGMTRIVDDSAKIRASRAVESELTGYLQNLRWPVYGRVTGIFGSQRILNGIPHAFHAGLDIAAPLGTELCAPMDGRVSLVAPNMLLTGNSLALDHGFGVSSIYAHLQTIKVKHGQRVKRGQRIATIGMTGRATGPHVHWGIFWHDIAVDPALLLPPPPAEITAKLNRCPIRK